MKARIFGLLLMLCTLSIANAATERPYCKGCTCETISALCPGSDGVYSSRTVSYNSDGYATEQTMHSCDGTLTHQHWEDGGWKNQDNIKSLDPDSPARHTTVNISTTTKITEDFKMKDWQLTGRDSSGNKTFMYYEWNGEIFLKDYTKSIENFDEDYYAKQHITISPNPATDIVHLEIDPNLFLDENVNIIIRSQESVTLYSNFDLNIKDLGYKLDIDVSQFNSWVYSIQINSNGFGISTSLVIVK